MQGSMLWLLLTATCAAAMVSGSQPSLSNGRKLRQGGSAETVRPCKPLFVPVLLHCAPCMNTKNLVLQCLRFATLSPSI